jgi:palmitoyltransferase ZDHHC9/14/18
MSYPTTAAGKVPITTASGEFSGYQQYVPPKDPKFGGHSRLSSNDNDGVIESSYSHETHPTVAGSGVVTNADEDDLLNQGKPVRNYKLFPGRNVFLCGGRIMTSRDFPAFTMAVMLILVPTGLFHGFT